MRQCLSTVKGGLMYRTLYIHSSNLLAPFAGKPVTHVTCQSSVLVPALTAQPTFIYMMDMPATTLTATATMASARLTSSNASLCGEQVNQWMLATCKFMHNLCFSKVKHCFIFMITLWGVFVSVQRSKARPWDLLWESQLCRRSLRELREGLQRLLCQMWCKVMLRLHWCGKGKEKLLWKTKLISSRSVIGNHHYAVTWSSI